MVSSRVSLLLCCFGVLSARKGAPDEGLCENGATECPIIFTAKVDDNGMTSLTVPIDTTKQILVCKCNPPKDCREIGLVTHGKVHSSENNSEISFDNQNFRMWNRGERHEFYYKFKKLLDGTCLAQVNVTPFEPPVPSPDLPSDTPMILGIGLPLAILAVVVLVAAVVQKRRKKRRPKESSSSTSTAKWMVNCEMAIGLLRYLVNRAPPEDCSEPSTGSNTAILSTEQDVPV